MPACDLCGRATGPRSPVMPANLCNRANCRAVRKRAVETRYENQSLGDAARVVNNGRIVTSDSAPSRPDS